MSWRANTKQNTVYFVLKILTKRKSETKRKRFLQPWWLQNLDNGVKQTKGQDHNIIRASLNTICWQPQCASHAIWGLNLHIYKHEKTVFNKTAIEATYRRNYSPLQYIFCSNFLRERRRNLSRVYGEALGQRSNIVNFRNALSWDNLENYLSGLWIPKRLACMILFLRISANKGKCSGSFEAKRRLHDHRHCEKFLTSSHTKKRVSSFWIPNYRSRQWDEQELIAASYGEWPLSAIEEKVRLLNFKTKLF